jgi:hypothetical protein
MYILKKIAIYPRLSKHTKNQYRLSIDTLTNKAKSATTNPIGAQQYEAINSANCKPENSKRP